MKNVPYVIFIIGVTVTMSTHKTNPDVTGDSVFKTFKHNVEE